MDELHRDNQLNNTSSDAEFTIDAIVSEFSGIEPLPQTPAEDEDAEEIKIWKPHESRAPKPEEADENLPEEADDEPDAAAETEESLFRLPFALHLLQSKVSPEDPVPPTPEEAAAQYARQRRHLRLCAALSWVLMLLSAAVAVLQATPQRSFAPLSPVLCCVLSLGILLLHAVLALELLRRGMEAILRARFTADSGLLLLTLVSAVWGFVALSDGTMSLAPAASLVLTLSVWSECRLAAAKYRSLRGFLSMDKPVAAARFSDIWQGRDALYRTKDHGDELSQQLEVKPQPMRMLELLLLLLSALSLAAAIVLSVRADRNFWWVWNLLLLAIYPLGGFTAYGHAFSRVSRQLQQAGAVLGGWDGAKQLSGSVSIILTDGDLFPGTALRMNGIRSFSEDTADRLLGYAAAVLERSDALVLADLFSQTLEIQGGRRFKAANFRAYEAGGLGGEVQGKVVLLGSVAFMQTMGISLPEDSKLQQALYISVNGQAMGVFALSYRASDAVRGGLASLLSSRGLHCVLAAGDIFLTPEMLQKKYRLPTDRMEYPLSRERARLASVPDRESIPGAFLVRNSFLAFARTVCAGRQLKRSIAAAAAAALVGAFLGLFLLALLALVGAFDAASAVNMILYHLIWLFPSFLITAFIGK